MSPLSTRPIPVLASFLLFFFGNRSLAHQECGIYLAPSTIPNAGLGMFSGNKHWNKNDVVSYGDIVIPVFELNWHMNHEPFHFLWDEYVWSASMFEGMEQEGDDMAEIHACSPGFGAAVNCMLPLVNVADEEYSFGMTQAGVASTSPGAGAFTPYQGRRFVATQEIVPGAELFASYGETYFTTRGAYGSVPLQWNYEQADVLLESFQNVTNRLIGRTLELGDATPSLSMDSFGSSGECSDTAEECVSTTVSETTSSVIAALWEFIKSEKGYHGEYHRTLKALPQNVTQVAHVLQTGGTSTQFYNHSIQSLEWLEEHGRCMDNIKDGISTIPHAGKGAFATRFIPKDGLVAPMPLIQIHRDLMTMYEASETLNENDNIVRDSSRPLHQQLILNYCFGHRTPNLLLCPYGLLTSLINHSSEQPNAKIIWSEKLTAHPEWKNRTMGKWGGKKSTGLAFEVVALRDIQEDEEVFIDYGDEWQEAWNKHVQSFDTPRHHYVPAYELNMQKELQVRTIDEFSYEMQGILLFCRKSMVEWSGIVVDYEGDTKEWNEEAYPCRARYRWDDNSYTVELFKREFALDEDGEELEEEWEDKVTYVVLDAPRDIFYFVDAIYERDHHAVWSFRHDMRIPDDLFPEKWMNLKDSGPHESESSADTTTQES